MVLDVSYSWVLGQRHVHTSTRSTGSLLVLYNTRTLVQYANTCRLNQLLGLHEFHISPAARIPLGHDGSFVCFNTSYLRFAASAGSSTTSAPESTRCTPSSRRTSSIHWSKLRIVLFFDERNHLPQSRGSSRRARYKILLSELSIVS